MKALRFFFSIVVLSLCAAQAQAQYVVKRVKCADAVPWQEGQLNFLLHLNQMSSSKRISVQITRDGCRPKQEKGRYRLVVRSPLGVLTRQAIMERNNSRYPNAVIEDVATGEFSQVEFQTMENGAKVSGTFDYMYSWE